MSDNKFKRAFKYCKDVLMKTTNGMAIGLFGTLIIGTVFSLFAKIPGLERVGDWATIIQGLMGAGIGLGVALALKRNGVTVVTLMTAGFIGNYMFEWLPDKTIAQWHVGSIGDPLSCYVSVMLAAIVLKYVMVKKTPVDLILIPLLGLTVAISYSFLLAEWIHFVTIGIQMVIEASFKAVPFLMCIIISVLMGMALTAPISSVAICVAINIGSVPLAATAALIGCCTQMVGFAVHTARDNKWGSVIAVGIGTSMLQFKNILKKPLIWVPTIVVSAILGPFAMLMVKGLPDLPEVTAETYVATTRLLSVGAGMGTCGLVGPLNFLGYAGYNNWILLLEILCICVIAPGALVFGIDLFFRKMNWFKKGDFSLSNNL